jgi:hypothetical protein
MNDVNAPRRASTGASEVSGPVRRSISAAAAFATSTWNSCLDEK